MSTTAKKYELKPGEVLVRCPNCRITMIESPEAVAHVKRCEAGLPMAPLRKGKDRVEPEASDA